MKEKIEVEDIKKRKGTESISRPNANEIYQKGNEHIINFSFKNSYKQLEIRNIIKINIIKSQISVFQDSQPYKYLTQNDFILINEINKKYRDYPEPIFNNEEKLTIQPFLDPNSENNFGVSQTNQNLATLFENILINQNQLADIQNLNENLFFENFSPKNNNLTFLYNITNDGNFSNDNFENKRLLLNNKRRRNFFGKIRKKSMVIITKDKNKTNNNEYINETVMDIKEEESDNNNNKKIIFLLSKGEKTKTKCRCSKDSIINKIKKIPGRKKKGSNEEGVHNKFSKDNMMRKLKNKVMESARKLINKIIKMEAGNEFKSFKELRKIEGIYSQELNIKFNFWFYFQKIKDIFQFKMSSKYSKGDLHSNNELINKIYSWGQKGLFQKTIELLELQFHEYYHKYFLGEEQDWYKKFDIKENKYELDFFLNEKPKSESPEINHSDEKYKKTIKDLAHKYELFFLKKNPRLSGNQKKEEKEESDSKKIIKNISPEEYKYYKCLFITTGSKYLPELENNFSKYLNDNKKYNKTILPSFNHNLNNEKNNSNNYTQKNDGCHNNKENTKNINENDKKNIKINNDNINIINKIKIIQNDKTNSKNNNKIKNNKPIFDVSKKVLFEIQKNEDSSNNSNNNKNKNNNINNNINNSNSNNNNINENNKNTSLINNNNDNYNKNDNIQINQNVSNTASNISNINIINNTKDVDLRQKVEKEMQTENIIHEEVNDDFVIVI